MGKTGRQRKSNARAYARSVGTTRKARRQDHHVFTRTGTKPSLPGSLRYGSRGDKKNLRGQARAFDREDRRDSPSLLDRIFGWFD